MAEETACDADKMQDADARQTMLEIAAAYRRLAALCAQRAQAGLGGELD